MREGDEGGMEAAEFWMVDQDFLCLDLLSIMVQIYLFLFFKEKKKKICEKEEKIMAMLNDVNGIRIFN